MAEVPTGNLDFRPHTCRSTTRGIQTCYRLAEPELLEENVAGLPTGEPPQADIGVGEVQRSEEDSRKRKEVEEKELIMDRLFEEERAQEEADAKVELLKGRLDALKKRRNEAKAARAKGSQ